MAACKIKARSEVELSEALSSDALIPPFQNDVPEQQSIHIHLLDDDVIEPQLVDQSGDDINIGYEENDDLPEFEWETSSEGEGNSNPLEDMYEEDD